MHDRALDGNLDRHREAQSLVKCRHSLTQRDGKGEVAVERCMCGHDASGKAIVGGNAAATEGLVVASAIDDDGDQRGVGAGDKGRVRGAPRRR